MAIQFLNVVDFNLNQAEEFVLENLGTDPATGQSDGRLIFNTADNVVKVYNGTAWIPLASGTFVETVTAGTYLTNSGTATNVIIDHDTTSRSDGTSSVSPGYGATFTAVDSVTSNTTGHVTAINLKTVTLPSAENYSWTLTGDSGTNQTINSGNTVDIAGGTNITTTVGATDTVTIDLDDSVSLTGSLTVGTTGSFTGQVTIPTTPVAGTDAASKAYVDGLVAGGLTFRGTFNAATGEILSGVNVGSYIYQLTGTPPAPFDPSANRVEVKVGDYYIVATAGQFYGNGGAGGGGQQLDVGDSVIGFQAASVNSSDKDDWSIVQSDEGVTDVQEATAANLLGASVTSTGAGGTGSVTVGLDIDSLSTGSLGFLEEAYLALYEDGAGANYKIALDDLAAAIDISKGVRISLDNATSGVTRTEAGGLTTFAIAVNNNNVLGATSALDVKAEITTAAGQTVYADITRSGTTLNVIFTGSVTNGTYSALLVDVG